MREIKFKIWNTLDKCFVSPKTSWFFSVLPEALKGSKYYEAYQYTGLKDINGVEIYEGDILARGEYVPARKVVFENGSFRLSDTTSQANQVIVDGTVRRLVVVGNIYENPELLGVDS